VVFDRRATKHPAKSRTALRVGATPAPRRVAGSLNRSSAIRLASALRVIRRRSQRCYTSRGLGALLLAVLGFALCLADATSAAERGKTIRTQDHRGGAVAGQLTGTFGKQVVYGAGETVTLAPLFVPGSQAIKIKTDGEGRFVFGGLPPGQYELKTQLNWTTTYIEVNDDGSSDRMYADHWKELVARVQVKSGQTIHVTTFSEGKTRNAFYAYGGTLSRPHHPLVSDD